MAANVNPRMKGFALGDVGINANVTVPYKHNSSYLPQVLNLYVRLLENIKVIFYMPVGFGIRVGVTATTVGTLYTHESPGAQVSGIYYSIEIPLDVEQDVFLSAGAIQVRLERYDSTQEHGYNTIRGKFYYNTSGAGEEAGVTFVGEPYQFNSETSYVTLRIEGIIFALTQYYIKLEGFMETSLTIRIVLPTFLSAYTMQLETPKMPATLTVHDVGGFISPGLSNGTAAGLHGTVDVWQRNWGTKITSNEGRASSWIADETDTTLKYTFNLIDKDVRFTFSSINDRDSNYSYLPTFIYKQVQFTGSTSDWERIQDPTYNLTNGTSYTVNDNGWNGYGMLNTGVENPVLTMTAVPWERPTIYFAMQKGSAIDTTGHEIQNVAFCTAPSIVNPNGVTIRDAEEISSDIQADNAVSAFVTSTLGLTIDNIYKMQLPDFYSKVRTSGGSICKMFRVKQHGNIQAGQPIGGHTYTQTLNGYFIDAYFQTESQQWDPSGLIYNDGTARYNTEATWSSATGEGTITLRGLNTLLPWTTIPNTLKRDLLLVIKPSMGDAHVSIVYMTYYNGQTNVSTVNLNEVVLSPIKYSNTSGVTENVLRFYINCDSEDDTIDNLRASAGAGNSIFDMTVDYESGNIAGHDYTHIFNIKVTQNMFDFNRTRTQAGQNMVFYTN